MIIHRNFLLVESSSVVDPCIFEMASMPNFMGVSPGNQFVRQMNQSVPCEKLP